MGQRKIIGGKRFFKVGKLYEIKIPTISSLKDYKVFPFGLFDEITMQPEEIFVLLSLPRWIPTKTDGYSFKILFNNEIRYIWLSLKYSPKKYFKLLKDKTN